MKTLGTIALIVIGGFVLVGLLVPLGYFMASNAWDRVLQKPEQTQYCSDVSTETVDSVNKPVPTEDNCLFEAGEKRLPKEIAQYVCKGKAGSVSLQLQSGVYVPFGTFTMDAEWRVWILSKFTVPAVANYSFSYENAERNLLQAPFILGSELGWKDGERVPFQVCYNFEGDCFLPADIVSQLFPTK